jgi:hypothetical protein
MFHPSQSLIQWQWGNALGRRVDIFPAVTFSGPISRRDQDHRSPGLRVSATLGDWPSTFRFQPGKGWIPEYPFLPEVALVIRRHQRMQPFSGLVIFNEQTQGSAIAQPWATVM